MRGTANSSTSITFQWDEIDGNLRNGEIISYEVKYKKRGAVGDSQSVITSNQTVLLTGLDEYTEYTTTVAGINSMGVGIFSTAIIQRTLEDGK